MQSLYFAPINTLGNYIYRHFLLEEGADFVFSELLLAKKFHEEYYQRKIEVPTNDIPRTIFQIGVGTSDDAKDMIQFLVKKIKGIREINLNMGCPQSTLQKEGIGGGILLNQAMMRVVAKSFAEECRKQHVLPSVKLRLGTSEEEIQIHAYLNLLSLVGIKKIYVHLRPLRYNYTKPALYTVATKLKAQHPELQLILNGDIDSYEAYEQLMTTTHADGIMIGRAALSNPLIFKQIKNKRKTRKGPYNPLLKDPELLISQQGVVMSKEKQEAILKFLRNAKELSLSVLKANLSWLTKGVSARGAFIDAIVKEQNLSKIIETFKEHFFS